MFSVQFEPGQSGAPAIGVVGEPVLTLKLRLPFLISAAGSACTPVNVTSAGFWPGGWVLPDGFVHVATGCPVAVRVMTTSPLPSPVSAPDEFRNRPPSLKTGLPCLKCTFAANATVEMAAIEPTSAATTTKRFLRRISCNPPWVELTLRWVSVLSQASQRLEGATRIGPSTTSLPSSLLAVGERSRCVAPSHVHPWGGALFVRVRP